MTAATANFETIPAPFTMTIRLGRFQVQALALAYSENTDEFEVYADDCHQVIAADDIITSDTN